MAEKREKKAQWPQKAPYTGLELTHLGYDGALEAAGGHGFNAIVYDLSGRGMFLARLSRSANGDLQATNVYFDGLPVTNLTRLSLERGSCDIYRIGPKAGDHGS